MNSPKRPHTPHLHLEHKELSPKVEHFPEEEVHLDKQKEDWDVQNSNQSQNKGVTEKPPKEVLETQLTTNEDSNNVDVEEFEPILSDEDILDDSEHFQDADYDYTAYTNTDDLIKLFVPGSCLIQKYKKPSKFNISVETFTIDDSLKVTIGIADEFFR